MSSFRCDSISYHLPLSVGESFSVSQWVIVSNWRYVANASPSFVSLLIFHNHASKYITHHKLEMMFFSFSMLVVVLVSIFVTVLQMQILVLGCQRTQFHWILLLNGLLDNPLLCIDSLHHCIIHFSQSKLVVVNLCDHLQRYLKSKDNKFLNLVFCWIRLKTN